jgi:hypothetical protein
MTDSMSEISLIHDIPEKLFTLKYYMLKQQHELLSSLGLVTRSNTNVVFVGRSLNTETAINHKHFTQYFHIFCFHQRINA